MRKLLVILALLVMSMGSFVRAQDVNCGTLDAASCDVLTQAAAASASLSSASFDFAVDIVTPDGAINLTGDGSFGGDFSAIDANALGGVTDPAVLIEALKPVFTGANAELNLGIASPEQGLPEGMLAFNLKLVDGIGYFNFESLGMLLGGTETLTAMGLPASWGGLDLIDTLDNLAPMMSGMSAEGTDAAPAMDEEFTAMVMKYGVVTAEAGDGVVVFVTTIDFAGLMQEPAFLELVMAQAAAQSGEEITPEMMAEAAPMLQQLASAITMNVKQTVETATFNTTSVGFELGLDGAAMAALSGTGDSGSLTVTGVFNLANHNSAPAVTAPEGAPVAKFMDLMTLVGSMSGQ